MTEHELHDRLREWHHAEVRDAHASIHLATLVQAIPMRATAVRRPVPLLRPILFVAAVLLLAAGVGAALIGSGIVNPPWEHRDESVLPPVWAPAQEPSEFACTLVDQERISVLFEDPEFRTGLHEMTTFDYHRDWEVPKRAPDVLGPGTRICYGAGSTISHLEAFAKSIPNGSEEDARQLALRLFGDRYGGQVATEPGTWTTVDDESDPHIAGVTWEPPYVVAVSLYAEQVQVRAADVLAGRQPAEGSPTQSLLSVIEVVRDALVAYERSPACAALAAAERVSILSSSLLPGNGAPKTVCAFGYDDGWHRDHLLLLPMPETDEEAIATLNAALGSALWTAASDRMNPHYWRADGSEDGQTYYAVAMLADGRFYAVSADDPNAAMRLARYVRDYLTRAP